MKIMMYCMVLMSGLLCPHSACLWAQAPDMRVDVHRGIPYAAAQPMARRRPQTLRFDLYRPAGDTCLRPLVIALFGGAFVLGRRDYPDMARFCHRFAEQGYVAASIDYRLMPIRKVSNKNFLRSGYMGAQDLTEAIRYFKAHSRDYRIDTTRIYLLGNSAGSAIILHALFLDEHERPSETRLAPDLGQLPSDASISVAGAVALWGCLFDPQIIDDTESTPICLVHGTRDRIVPYQSGNCFNMRRAIYVHGSAAIAERFDALGKSTCELHSFVGERHAFYFDWLSIFHLNKTKFDACFDIALSFFNRCGRKL